GSALAELFEKCGTHVFATACTLSEMPHLQNRLNVTLVEPDVISSSSIAETLEFVKAKADGTLDYLLKT
ncbi:hypothetical protein B0O99DRAFT_475798, partial [Bisporella sp. PMI_857]